MGRAKRGGPGGRSYPWLNLCKSNSELRKLLPAYFSKIAHNHTIVCTRSSGMNTTVISNAVCSSSETQQDALREISNNLAAGKVRKSGATSQSSLYHIDEDATTKLHQLINFSLISKSLNLSPIQWKSVPQLYGIKHKHNSAICGVIIKKKKKGRKSSKALSSERTPLHKCKEKKKSEETARLSQLAEAHTDFREQSDTIQNVESKTESHKLPTSTDGNLSEDSTVTTAVGKRQRRLTAKAAEAIAEATLRRHRKTLTSSCSKGKIMSDDEHVVSENEKKTADASKTANEVEPVSVADHVSQLDSVVKSPFSHTTPLVDKEKVEPQVKSSLLDIAADEINTEILSTVTPVVEERNFISKTTGHKTPLLPDTPNSAKNNESLNPNKDESFIETTVVDVTARDQPDYLVTNTCEIKSLSDDPIESKNNDESVNSLQDLVIRESVQVFDTSTSEQQGVIGTVENLSYNIEPSPRSFVQLKSEVSDGVSDELDRKTTIAEEILIQTDIQAVTEGNESEALDKENDSVETEEARNIDQPSELEYNDQEQPEVNNETDRNVESNSVDDSGSTPPMKFDVHNPPVIKTVKPRAHKRSPSPGDAPIIRSKRRLKVNHRFLDDFDGYLGFIKGGHRSRASSEVSNGSEGSSNRTTEHSTRHSHRTSKSRLLSWYNKKHSNEKIKKTSVLENPTKSSKGDKSNDSHNTNSKQEEKCGNRPVTGLRPRVKQVSRPSLNREDSRYSSTFSAMVHAARLAAVGAKVPGGVSPVHAALAASAAHSNRMKERRSDAKHNDLNVNGQGVIPHSTFHPSKPVSTAQNSTHLPKRCGQCPACLGLIQPCGHCSDCRLVDNNDPRRRPCRELICFRRRAAVAAADQNLKTGPRVKFPSNYPSPGSSSSLPICGYKGALSNNMVSHASNRSALHRSDNEPDESVSFLRTVPGLAQKLELDAWLPPVNSQKMHTSGVNPSYHRKQKHAGKNLNVGPELQVTPVRGGDLGMHFISSIEENDDNEDLDRVRPVEGEVIDSELATRGGYAVVTTLAAAPPKEICYACGSGGGQLLFCVSCAEPFHFYCVERQFRPLCRRPASDLRCIRCSVGYHPDCLLDFPPAKTSQRGCWTCPECSVCLHCGVRACKPAETSDVGTSSIVRGNYTPWSLETNKCAACSQAESRGDLCPECDRAYLPSTKQMVQCDSCQLWIHRTCTKLTVDEYELIARMPAGQLSKFVVICSVCQKEQKSQQKSNSSRSNNPSKQSDFQDQSGTDMTENTDEDNEGMNNRNTNSPNSVAHQLRMLAQDTLLERMAGLVQNCCRPSEHDQNAASSINSPSSVSVHSPTHMTASSGGKSPGLGSSVNNKNEHPTRQCLPQYDGVCDSDSGDELTAAVEAAASLWNPLVEPSKITPTSENPGLLPSISINNQSCEIVCDTLSTSGISSDPVSVSSNLTSQPFQTNTLSLTSPMDSIRNSGNAVSSEISVLPIQPSPLTVNTGYKTEFSPLQPNVHSETALRECYPNSSRRRYSSSSSSSSRQIIVPAPPISALWLVDNESEDIWTSPRSLVYRILTRILRRLSAHAVSSEAAGILRKLLCWFTSVTQAFFPWLNVTEMASDVRDILRQSNGKFSDVVKHFQELSLIELHELVCPVIARLSENCSRCQKHFNMLSTHSRTFKEYHLNYQLNESTELDPLEVTKQFVAVCKRSRCRRPHEVEMFEQMKQSARDDRWIEYWSSIEEEMVVKKFQII
ncbi:unnamed protein product [Heterobilharzia americana]|nr:unnamed protein product [Heterobilharzia americana]